MKNYNYEIREILTEEEIHESVSVLQKSYMTVAGKFGFTRESVPTNTAFISFKDLIRLQVKGDIFFGVYFAGEQVGFVALEKTDSSVFYLKKLGVIPTYRNKGCGNLLMDHCFKYVKTLGGKKISISIINEDEHLKRWYVKYGFREVAIKDFPHLPFKVCFLEKPVEKTRSELCDTNCEIS